MFSEIEREEETYLRGCFSSMGVKEGKTDPFMDPAHRVTRCVSTTPRCKTDTFSSSTQLTAKFDPAIDFQ